MTENHFRRFWALGYRRLLPVVPASAPLRNAGKRPGLNNGHGWYGVGSQKFDATEELLDVWHDMGAGVGIRCDSQSVGVDIDTLSTEWAPIIARITQEALGETASRVGNPPKVLLPYQNSAPIRYRSLRFDDGTEKGGLIELQAGQNSWYVAHGVHPTAQKPYHWPQGTPPRADLPSVTQEQMDALFEHLEADLPKAKRNGKNSTDRAQVDQDSLKAKDLDLFARAMRSIPNRYEEIGGYDKWIEIIAAVRGACQDDYSLGLDLVQEFSERSDLDDLTEDTERAYRTLPGPYGLGADYIYSLAQRIGDKQQFDRSEVYYDPKDVEPPKTENDVDFHAIAIAQQEEAAPKDPPIKWVRPGEWEGITPPEREWEVEGWIPRYEVTLLYGDGGIGKTLAIHQYATAAAAGVDWLGQKTRKAKVMCFFCEDSEEELLRRQIDINRSMGLTFEDVDQNLRIASRKFMDNLLILWDRNTGALKRQAVWKNLKNDALEFGAEVIIVDTIADTFGGNEIDRAQVNAFIKSCLGRLAQEIGGSVIALGHPSQSGKMTGSGTSGSTAWSNAVRARMYLRYPKGVEKGNIRELEGMKLNYGAKGNLLKLRWQSGAFEVLAASVTPVSPDSAPKASHGGPVSVEAASDMAVYDAVQAQAGLGVAMSLKPNSPHYAPKVLKRREPDMLAGYSPEEIEAAFARLERRGAVVEAEVGRKGNRHPVMGFEAVPGALFGDTAAVHFEAAETTEEGGGSGVFD